MPRQQVEYDVFLSHASTDKAAVRELAERLKGDGLRHPNAPGDDANELYEVLFAYSRRLARPFHIIAPRGDATAYLPIDPNHQLTDVRRAVGSQRIGWWHYATSKLDDDDSIPHCPPLTGLPMSQSTRRIEAAASSHQWISAFDVDQCCR